MYFLDIWSHCGGHFFHGIIESFINSQNKTKIPRKLNMANKKQNPRPVDCEIMVNNFLITLDGYVKVNPSRHISYTQWGWYFCPTRNNHTGCSGGLLVFWDYDITSAKKNGIHCILNKISDEPSGMAGWRIIWGVDWLVYRTLVSRWLVYHRNQPWKLT